MSSAIGEKNRIKAEDCGGEGKETGKGFGSRIDEQRESVARTNRKLIPKSISRGTDSDSKVVGRV